MKKTFKLLTNFLLAIVIAFSFAVPVSAASTSTCYSFGLDYSESVKSIKNIDQGWYRAVYITAKETDTQWPNIERKEEALLHLRIDLSNFSGNAGAASDLPLSEDFLSGFYAFLNHVRDNHKGVILRFAYDYDGNKNQEPELSMIQTHIAQLEEIFREYSDIIAAIESGFLGPYGEQHSSFMFKNGDDMRTAYLKTVVDALLDVTDSDCPILVRRPKYLALICGYSSEAKLYAKGVTEQYSRVGIFNDGLYGNETDLGTFNDRENTMDWMKTYNASLPYGGEAVLNRSEEIDYSDGNLVAKEMFDSHLNYLNISWHPDTKAQWKAAEYQGDDPAYHGENCYTFIENHMGYRFLITNSWYCENADSLTLSFLIKNVGAGNLLKDRNVTVIAVDEEKNVSEYAADLHPTDWKSLTTKKESVSVPLPDEKTAFYIKVSDQNGNQTEFAGKTDFTEYGNLIGIYDPENKGEIILPEETEESEKSEISEDQLPEISYIELPEKVVAGEPFVLDSGVKYANTITYTLTDYSGDVSYRLKENTDGTFTIGSREYYKITITASNQNGTVQKTSETFYAAALENTSTITFKKISFPKTVTAGENFTVTYLTENMSYITITLIDKTTGDSVMLDCSEYDSSHAVIHIPEKGAYTLKFRAYDFKGYYSGTSYSITVQ